jgi:glycine C-acetyltransferase
MDANAFVEFLNLPFRQRLQRQYDFHRAEQDRGYMAGRTGMAPVGPRQGYKDLHGERYRQVLVFGSNSYLNLHQHPAVVQRVIEATQRHGVGTGGSPAFSGYTRQHRELELRLAALAGHEDALLMPSGYMANLCWVNGLMTRKDVLLYDRHSHASVINAIKMTGVQFFPYDPDRLDIFEGLLAEVRRTRPGAQVFVTVEGVRSSDGCVIALEQLLVLCRARDAFVILDDAHGVGVLGEQGAGTLEHLGLMGQVDMRMSTCPISPRCSSVPAPCSPSTPTPWASSSITKASRARHSTSNCSSAITQPSLERTPSTVTKTWAPGRVRLTSASRPSKMSSRSGS